MKIFVDQEGAKVLNQLLDIVLKSNGIEILGTVINIQNSTQVISDYVLETPEIPEKDTQ